MNKIILILIITVQFLNAQSIVNKKLFELYDKQKFEELKTELEKLDVKNKSLEIEFLETIFLDNGEDAVKIYQNLFDKSYGELKSIVAKKLSDYYYAKGFYLTAAKYQKYLVETTNTKNQSETQKDKYIIQLGAFGLKDNAVQLKEMLMTQNLFSRIVERDINGNTLYCVWLDGKDGFNETIDYAENIKEKYHLQYRILQQ